MEYSKDIILNIKYSNEKLGQARKNLLKKSRVIATISIICGILIILDCILVFNFIELLQTII